MLTFEYRISQQTNGEKMGYTTEFNGGFKLNKKLDDDTFNLLVGLATTRRMKRNLPEEYGVDGEFYYDPKSKDFGQEEDPSIVNYNIPPSTQPGLWCGWIPTEDGMEIVWNEVEKFYNYVEWLEYLIGKILAPRGYILNGKVDYRGEDFYDLGTIVINNNSIKCHILYFPE